MKLYGLLSYFSPKILSRMKIDQISVMYRSLISIFYCGNKRFCPVCGKSSRKFRAFGDIPRKDALCVHCCSLERHRFVWLYFMTMTNLFEGRNKLLLHIAPEACFEKRLKKLLGDNYITADLLDHRAMMKMDITDMQFPDRYFDVIYCSHVLEHVQDDKKAIREMYRVLKKDGWAIILVPVTTDKTLEDPAIIDPSERRKLFGQADHVRRYGPDFVERLKEGGFQVTVTYVSDLLGQDKAIRMGLTTASGEIFYCTKSSNIL
jgi:SAM-dependent methyltransferase